MNDSIHTTLNGYLKGLYDVYSTGDAREESYYSVLETFLRKLWKSIHKPHSDPNILILPKKTDAGNPDIVIRTPHSQLIGYIEVKSPSKTPEKLENSEQIKRYRSVFPNFILTNLLEFRFYRSGQCTGIVRLTEDIHTITGPQTDTPQSRFDTYRIERFIECLTDFFAFTYQCHSSARDLAEALAIRTRFFRDQVVMEELKAASTTREKEPNSHIYAFYIAFKTYLIHHLTIEDFADLYSQTLTYGLFIAAVRSDSQFERETAVHFIPQTSGILHDVFQFISLGRIPKQLAISLNDVVDVLKTVNCKRLLDEYFFIRQKKEPDPILHFYETFLTEYDPHLRERQGVYYTPDPVVWFIIEAIHILLIEKLNRPDGLASPDVFILDPAAGTSAFLIEAAKTAINTYSEKYGNGGKSDFARNFLLNHLYGFEEMMAPYAVGHLKMSYMLEALNISLNEDERFNYYLTNTLDMEHIEQSNLPGMSTLSQEAHLAAKIKKETKINVIPANPPYSYHSHNESETITSIPIASHRSSNISLKKMRNIKVKTWIGEKIEDYKKLDGRRMDEKNVKGLQDDYVKFIRFAQAKIDDAGEGIVGYITNHGYLDNPTFRGMRQSLMTSFDEIYILDLHGNASKKEKTPDRTKDENIFDIRQGVAIALFIKFKPNQPPTTQTTNPTHAASNKKCRVFHADVWGTRTQKFDFLMENSLNTIQWNEIQPEWEFYQFRPHAINRETDKNTWDEMFYKITEIFPVHSVGIVTARDNLTIRDNPQDTYREIQKFAHMTEQDARSTYTLGEDTRDWHIKDAQRDLIESGIDPQKIVPILYRPFDIRYTYYTGKSRGFHSMPRSEVMKHMLNENIGLITVRQVAEGNFNHSYITDTIVDSRITTSNKGIGFLFPLYIYPYDHIHTTHKNNPNSPGKSLFASLDEKEKKQANLNPKLLDLFTRKARFYPQPTPEQIFYYIYAVLFSNTYREKYAHHLKIDFPRIPFTKNQTLFQEVGELGRQLTELHRLKSPQLDETTVKFEIEGNNTVERIRFLPGDQIELINHPGRVYINKKQYFSNVSENVWNYNLAGYHVLEKYLKSRKGKKLTHNQLRQFIRIARSLELTIPIQQEIDRLYPSIESDLIGM